MPFCYTILLAVHTLGVCFFYPSLCCGFFVTVTSWFLLGYFWVLSLFKGANLRPSPAGLSWFWVAIVTQGLGLKTIGFYYWPVGLFVPIQLVVGFFAAISCYLRSASSIFSCWGVFYKGWLNWFTLELVKLIAVPGVDIPLATLVLLNCT